MTGRKDYVPPKDADFTNWLRNVVEYVNERTSGDSPLWANIPPSETARLNAAYADWLQFYEPTLSPHEPAVTTEKNNARRRVEPVARGFVQRFLQWPPVTDGDRTNMAIPIHDKTPTPHIEVTETVEMELALRNIREILVVFKIKGAAHKAKPTGYDGAVIVWDVLDSPPASPDALTRHTMASKTPHALEFSEEERGKSVYVSAAWQNQRGNVGPWSDILRGIVP